MTNDILSSLTLEQAQIVKNNRQLVRLMIIGWWHENGYITIKQKFNLEFAEIRRWHNGHFGLL